MGPDFALRLTERLRLRRVDAADLGDLISLSVDPRVNAHRPGGAPTIEEARDIVRGFIADWEQTVGMTRRPELDADGVVTYAI